MRTSKPFSMISYNSDGFLKITLNELIKGGLIQFWAYIHHLPEEDEAKAHKHLYIMPNKLLDTQTIEKALQEIDPNNPLAKPLGAIFPRVSKFDDWYLYCLHDKKYLASKGQTRQYTYNDNAFIVSCQDTFRELKNLIDYSAINRYSDIIEKIERGESLPDILKTTNIPLQLIGQVKQLYYIINDSIIGSMRNNRRPYDPNDDNIFDEWVEFRRKLQPVEDEEEIKTIKEIFKGG
jgi:hypothetical protein